MITPTCKPLAAIAIAGTDRLKLEQHYTAGHTNLQGASLDDASQSAQRPLRKTMLALCKARATRPCQAMSAHSSRS